MDTYSTVEITGECLENTQESQSHPTLSPHPTHKQCKAQKNMRQNTIKKTNITRVLDRQEKENETEYL